MTKPLFILLFCVFVLSSCNKEELNLSTLKVEVLTYSGMCGTILLKIDSLNTQLDSTKLVCQTNKALIKRETSTEKFNRMKQYVSTLNLMNFKNSSCARCTDGVDYIFKLTMDDKSNEFSISRNMSADFGNKEKFEELLLFIDTFNNP
ncbi:hypothetical protein ACFRAE_05130 [Sphingobacterium sp. HJSM2_6]|uniref:hypothetical protein n=1 Tax=Sphingobacterium sp. HJSM2_6 TaxID=3366264 RepID=UPI003BCAD631